MKFCTTLIAVKDLQHYGTVFWNGRFWCRRVCIRLPVNCLKRGRVWRRPQRWFSTRFLWCRHGTTSLGALENSQMVIHIMIELESWHDDFLRWETTERITRITAVLSPLQPHPEPDDSGCGSIIKDRFGFTWIITCPNPHPVKRG